MRKNSTMHDPILNRVIGFFFEMFITFFFSGIFVFGPFAVVIGISYGFESIVGLMGFVELQESIEKGFICAAPFIFLFCYVITFIGICIWSAEVRYRNSIELLLIPLCAIACSVLWGYLLASSL